MKTASARDLRQNFPRILAWIEEGEQVTITRRRKVIARLVPAKQPGHQEIESPDFEAIGREIFGDRIFEEDLMEREREGYRS